MSEKRIDIFRGIVIVLVLGLVLVSTLSIKSVDAQVGQVTLKPSDDTYVDSSSPNSNYGERNFLQIMNYNSEINSANESMVWLKFNLSSVPDGAVIDGAMLRLRTSSATGSFNVNAYSGSDFLNASAVVSWTELTLTYSNMPGYNTTSMDSVLVATNNQWYNWSVVDAVGDTLNDTVRTVTMTLLSPSPSGIVSSVSFNSKEFSISDYAPSLTVHWSGVVPEFPSFFVLSLFMIATLLAVIVYRKKHADISGSS